MILQSQDEFYSYIKKYDPEGIEYYLMTDDEPHQGTVSHQKALLFAMRAAGKEGRIEMDIEKAKAKRIDADTLLYVPNVQKKDRLRNTTYDCEYKNNADGSAIPYWYAFLQPPYHAGFYEPEDFKAVNEVLFPCGAKSLEVYEWSTDWSDYFDDGHEWWGASCFSIYDSAKDRYVVILVSATD